MESYWRERIDPSNGKVKTLGKASCLFFFCGQTNEKRKQQVGALIILLRQRIQKYVKGTSEVDRVRIADLLSHSRNEFELLIGTQC